jgi:hypothetical protein
VAKGLGDGWDVTSLERGPGDALEAESDLLEVVGLQGGEGGIHAYSAKVNESWRQTGTGRVGAGRGYERGEQGVKEGEVEGPAGGARGSGAGGGSTSAGVESAGGCCWARMARTWVMRSWSFPQPLRMASRVRQ